MLAWKWADKEVLSRYKEWRAKWRTFYIELGACAKAGVKKTNWIVVPGEA